MQPDFTLNSETPPAASQNGLSDRQAFAATQRAVLQLEGSGVSDFQFFNALADFYHRRGQSDLSALMAEAAYHCYQQLSVKV
ncbi:hypothetical protein [Almyronema epifaneia]|uniref:Uncharacterized protein n=1 Tax=Almyronema epifaneia S1 TaxID=2991925 RepID=A0ABW6I967_9CYAN